MHVNAKRIAFLGLLLAFDILLITLGSIIEMNTLFFLAGASFCVGIAIRENGLRLGFGFFLGSILLSFILSPNKFYCITYGAMSCYLYLREYAWEKTMGNHGDVLAAFHYDEKNQNRCNYNENNHSGYKHNDNNTKKKVKNPVNRKRLLWMLKFIVFNILYIPMMIFFPKLIYQGDLTPIIYGVLFLGGQVGLIIYDYTYNYFQLIIWGKMRRILNI
jgi:hypothetical protein